ncbi:ArsR/SmtB family transcription factor [Rhizosaccharibacter radicis]|uniref:Helix-turn-helix domain-containing protein n=1 Tax=Rhizosaccharibacter radicis TaxID=2782605 RepID=A0ABT1VUJ9_9PROT|nr:helix-turn-helix domain-containing protein [Acetobacteraceae bacterium KSS12]
MAQPPTPDLSATDVTLITRALADPRRYGIVTQVAGAGDTLQCCALAEAGRVSPSTMTHHLQQLEQAGLIEVTRDGRFAKLRFVRDRYERYLSRLQHDAAPAAARSCAGDGAPSGA